MRRTAASASLSGEGAHGNIGGLLKPRHLIDKHQAGRATIERRPPVPSRHAGRAPGASTLAGRPLAGCASDGRGRGRARRGGASSCGEALPAPPDCACGASGSAGWRPDGEAQPGQGDRQAGGCEVFWRGFRNRRELDQLGRHARSMPWPERGTVRRDQGISRRAGLDPRRPAARSPGGIANAPRLLRRRSRASPRPGWCRQAPRLRPFQSAGGPASSPWAERRRSDVRKRDRGTSMKPIKGEPRCRHARPKTKTFRPGNASQTRKRQPKQATT